MGSLFSTSGIAMISSTFTGGAVSIFACSSLLSSTEGSMFCAAISAPSITCSVIPISSVEVSAGISSTIASVSTGASASIGVSVSTGASASTEASVSTGASVIVSVVSGTSAACISFCFCIAAKLSSFNSTRDDLVCNNSSSSLIRALSSWFSISLDSRFSPARDNFSFSCVAWDDKSPFNSAFSVSPAATSFN